MLRYTSTIRDPNELELGGHFDHVDYCWKPFSQRNPEHQADYLRLEKDLAKRGMINPVIVFRDHVLIGQRRVEIARKLGIDKIPCWEITEDITHDANPDRVLELRDKAYRKVDY